MLQKKIAKTTEVDTSVGNKVWCQGRVYIATAWQPALPTAIKTGVIMIWRNYFINFKNVIYF